MNHRQRYQTSRELAASLQKAQTLDRNALNAQIMRYVSAEAPLFTTEDVHSYIKEGYELNSVVYAIVNGITKAGAAVPPIVYKITDKQKARKYKRFKSAFQYNVTGSQVEQALEMKEQAFEEVDERDDLHKLFTRPNPLQSFAEYYENAKGFQLVTGNTYTYKNLLTDGRVGEMWVMPAQWTKIHADGGSQELIKAYSIDLYGYTGAKIEADQVMHWKYWNPDYDAPASHLYGMSPLKAARRELRLRNDANTALSVALKNGGAKGMIFPEQQTKISPEQASQIRNFLSRNQGADNYQTFLTFSAKMGYQSFGHPPVDLEILETNKMTTRDLCNIYGYPSELLNDPDNKTNANKRESRKQLYLDVVIPTLERDYQEFNRSIAPHFGENYFIDYDLNAVEAIQTDMKDKVDWLAKAWWFTINERRKETGKDMIEEDWANEIYAPSNFIPIMMDSGFSEEEVKSLMKEYS